MPFSGTIGRIAYAVLAGVIAFVVLFGLGIIIAKGEPSIGDLIKTWSPVIGFLVGVVVFFTRPNPSV